MRNSVRATSLQTPYTAHPKEYEGLEKAGIADNDIQQSNIAAYQNLLAHDKTPSKEDIRTLETISDMGQPPTPENPQLDIDNYQELINEHKLAHPSLDNLKDYEALKTMVPAFDMDNVKEDIQAYDKLEDLGVSPITADMVGAYEDMTSAEKRDFTAHEYQWDEWYELSNHGQNDVTQGDVDQYRATEADKELALLLDPNGTPFSLSNLEGNDTALAKAIATHQPPFDDGDGADLTEVAKWQWDHGGKVDEDLLRQLGGSDLLDYDKNKDGIIDASEMPEGIEDAIHDGYGLDTAVEAEKPVDENALWEAAKAWNREQIEAKESADDNLNTLSWGLSVASSRSMSDLSDANNHYGLHSAANDMSQPDYLREDGATSKEDLIDLIEGPGGDNEITHGELEHWLDDIDPDYYGADFDPSGSDNSLHDALLGFLD